MQGDTYKSLLSPTLPASKIILHERAYTHGDRHEDHFSPNLAGIKLLYNTG